MRMPLATLLVVACGASRPPPKAPTPTNGSDDVTGGAVSALVSTHYDWLPDKPLLVTAVRVDDRIRQRLRTFVPFGTTSCGDAIIPALTEIVKVQESVEDKSAVIGLYLSSLSWSQVSACGQTLKSAVLKISGGDQGSIGNGSVKVELSIRDHWVVFSTDTARFEPYTVAHPPTAIAGLLDAADPDAAGYAATTLDMSANKYGAPMHSAHGNFVREGDELFFVGTSEWQDAETATKAAMDISATGATAKANGSNVDLRFSLHGRSSSIFPFLE